MRRSFYGAALRTALRATAAAYGYTLSTATTLSVLMVVRGKPDPARLFLFAIGGVVAFVLLEAIQHLLRPGEESPDQAFPLAGALNIVSVTAALGAAWGVSHLHSTLAWLLAPMAATSVYMLLVALQVSAVAGWRSRR